MSTPQMPSQPIVPEDAPISSIKTVVIYNTVSGKISQVATMAELRAQQFVNNNTPAEHSAIIINAQPVDLIAQSVINGKLVASPQSALDNAQWAKVKSQRNMLLSQSDWVTVRAADIGMPPPQAWLDYRQALRDITTQGDPYNIVWPVQPV